MTPRLGKDFGAAVCGHFGLPPDQVEARVRPMTGFDEVFGVELRIALTPDDLRSIAERMAAPRPKS